MPPAITRCPPSDSTRMAGLIARAFADNPITRWLGVHMGEERQALFLDYFHLFVEHAVHHGDVEVTADGLGVAIWFPPECGPPADYDARLARITGHHTSRFETLDTAMHDAHPTEPTHHLAFLAVAPEAQNRGHGTALLRHHHQRLDQLGMPAYLEASATRNRALYEREGYRLTGASIELPDGTPMWPMIKPPVRAARSDTLG